MAGKDTKIYKSVKEFYQEILTGTLISFDPSSGSSNSMPGYAIFTAGALVESGVIKLRPQDSKNVRLYSIAESIRAEFPKADVVAIENIPPVSYNRKGAMNGWALVSLQRAVGAIMSCFDCSYIEVAPASWQKYKFEGYNKSDEHDAICIGLACIEIAKQVNEDLKDE